MRNIIRIGAGTDGRNRFVAIALGVALAAGPAAMLPAAALAAPATDAAAASTTAGTTITLQGADGASLAGHTFDVYRIGTYTDQVLDGAQISSLGVRGDTASNAWAADAIGIANAYDPSTADDIGKVYGYDDAGNIANIKMDSQTRQLRNISKALAQSSRRPAAIQGGANLTTTRSTLTINVPSEGLYYITDSAGNPIMIGTKSGNANIMKNDAKDPQWRTLGTAVVKAKSVRVDKKVQVQRNGTTVGKDGTTNDPVGVTVGDTVTNTVEVTVPNKQAASAVKFKLVDQPKGQTYVKGSLSVRLKNAPQTDITADAVVYDGTTQNNAKSIPGDPTLKTADNRPADPDLAIPAGGWGIDGRNLLDKYSNRTIVITYRMTVDKASITDPANNTVHTYGTFTDGIRSAVSSDMVSVFASPSSMRVGTRTSSRSDIPSGMVPSGRHTTTSSPPPSSSVSLQMPVPSTDSRYSPSSGIPSRVNLHMRSPCPSIDPPIMPDARHIPSSCYFLSSVHESDTPSSPSGDDGPLPGCRPKMDSPSPNAPRDRSSPSNRSRSACSRSSRSQIS